MKVITKMELQPDMVLGEDIQDQNHVIYPAGTTVTPQIIEKLKRYNLVCVTIMEDIDFATTHYEKIRFDSNFKAFERAYPIFLAEYKLAMKQLLVMGRKPADIFLLTIYQELYYYITSGSVLLDYLYNLMPSEDELTYTQGLNAALLAGTFADWLSMSEEEKNTLILCGFYYDIGKLQLPYELLWKPGKLTEEEFKIIKTHPVVGYTSVRNQDLNEHVKNAVIITNVWMAAVILIICRGRKLMSMPDIWRSLTLILQWHRRELTATHLHRYRFWGISKRVWTSMMWNC